MKKYIGFGFLLAFFFAMSFSALDFFSSMTKVDFIDGTKTLKFTTKMNTAHVAEAIKINPNTAGFDAEVKKYVNNNFSVIVNGVSKTLTFTGSQVNGESVWVYFETDNVSDISNLKIKNSILLNAFPKQVNIVNVAYKGNQKTMTFQRGKEQSEIDF